MKKLLLFALFAFFCGQAPAQSVPALINYQGQLTDANGTNLPTADYILTFNIYDLASGGLLVWGPQVFDGTSSQGHGPKIPVVQGYFNVLLGSNDTAGRSLAEAFNGAARYVEIKLGANDPIRPRQQILTAPFAFKAGEADKVAGKVPGDFVAKAGDTMTGALDLPDAGLKIRGKRALMGGYYGMNGLTINPYNEWAVTTIQPPVGIGNFAGTFVPSASLHLVDYDPVIAIEQAPGSTGGVTLSLRESGSSANKARISMHDLTLESASGGGGGYLKISNGSHGDLAYFGADGNVGIGTFDSNQPMPLSSLHVYGDQPVVRIQQNPGIDGGPTLHLQGAGNSTNKVRIVMHGVTLESASGGGGGYFSISSGDMLAAYIGPPEHGRNFGIGRVPTANKLEVEGDASKTTAGTWLANSDARIKDDIEPVRGALEKLDQVRLVNFRYTDEYRQAHPSLENRRYLNVVAQEFATVFPDAVRGSGEKLPDGHEILQVDTHPLTIYSAAAIQELHQLVKTQQAELAAKDREIQSLSQRLAAVEAAILGNAGQKSGGNR
jgi:hypothetical protein